MTIHEKKTPAVMVERTIECDMCHKRDPWGGTEHKCAVCKKHLCYSCSYIIITSESDDDGMRNTDRVCQPCSEPFRFFEAVEREAIRLRDAADGIENEGIRRTVKTLADLQPLIPKEPPRC